MKLIDKIVKLYDNFMICALHIGSGYIGFSNLTSQYYGNPIYHLSGTLAGVVAHMLDIESTRWVTKLENSKEGKEFGPFTKEASPILGKHPTMDQLEKRKFISYLIWGSLSTIWPAIGYSYLSLTPILYKHHGDMKKEIEKEINSRKEFNKELDKL